MFESDTVLSRAPDQVVFLGHELYSEIKNGLDDKAGTFSLFVIKHTLCALIRTTFGS